MNFIREQFPQLAQTAHGKPLVYLDSAATTLKPLLVIEALRDHYALHVSNIHRGVHFFSEKATQEFENSREAVRDFIQAASPKEIIFTSGTTDSINLVAQSFGRRITQADEIVITHMEHHSNIVPWQMLRERTGCILRVVPLLESGELDLVSFEKILSPRTRLVSFTHVSNALGTVNPVKSMIQKVRAASPSAVVLVDGAQAVAHRPVNVQDLDCDFYAFSAHKLFGPTGLGVLYGKAALLESMPPIKGGGDMIRSVTFEKTIYNDLPYKFEAGTPAIAEVIAFRKALEFVSEIGFEKIGEHERHILAFAHSQLQEIPEISIIGTSRDKSGVISFVVRGVHPHDVGTIVDQQGVAIRTGHHCAQPVMDFYKIPATSRASFSIYNTEADVQALAGALRQTIEVFT